MVKLRLKRMGSKFNAFYRIVAADARAPRDGRFIEEIGYYNPHSKETFVNKELRTKWENEGAVASATVKNLFKKYDKVAVKSENGIVTLEVKPKKVKKEVKVEEVVAEEAPATETPTEAPAEEVTTEEAPAAEAPAEEVVAEEAPATEESTEE